eukprot:Nitzschia sp. Nitz4//scaffold6_size259037//228939//233468//NITZ4_001122-RA/size259037-augustus-gene-0.307-mRNA-1//1//CDS//3329557037//2513//frame0
MTSVHCGQEALLPMIGGEVPSFSEARVAPSMKVPYQSSVKDEGMLVYKVGKNGKLQARRLAFSLDNRALLVTSNKVTSLGSGLKKLVGGQGASETGNGLAVSLQSIDVSRMDHHIQGQVTKRFGLAKSNPENSAIVTTLVSAISDPDNDLRLLESLSLSLLYRECSKDTLMGKPETTKEGRQPRALESLDLIVPNPQHFKDLSKALQTVMDMYTKYREVTDSTTLLLENLYVEMGKSFDSGMSNGEWLAICDKMNVGSKRAQCSNLYKEALKKLPKDGRIKGGLPFSFVVNLWDELCYNHSLELSSHPLSRLWENVRGSDPVTVITRAPTGETVASTTGKTTISSVAFLSFIRSQQKEFQSTIEDAVHTMRVLNGTQDDKSEGSSERLSKKRFLQFLLSDANDILDPAMGRSGSDDMTHPLSHYWINTSHDTFLNHWLGSKSPFLDEQMYLAALNRGVRCLELDVWDLKDNPVISKDQPKTDEDPYLEIPIVLKIVRKFLLANPQSYPVILNIENHCTFANQERLADYIFEILGQSGLIVVPDDTASIDEADLLPSPYSMRGKVLIMGKRPRVIELGAKVVNDDFDDENDVYEADGLPNALSREMEESELDKGIVIGFDSAGPVKASKRQEANIVQHSTGELMYMAKQDLEQAKMDAAEAEIHALSLAEKADQAEKDADIMIADAGLTKESVLELANEVKGPEIDPKEHVALLSDRLEGEGVEVQEFFADGVEAARAHFTDADQVAIEAAAEATEALQVLNQATTKLREAEQALEKSYTKERTMVADYQKAAAEARAKREDAEQAKRRLEKVRQLRHDSETLATSAENVVSTATTEAKISEKRAVETEARAARAAKKAQDDRKRADEETRKEESLEKEAASLHEELTKLTTCAKDAHKAMEKAAAMIERVDEQIKLIEHSTQYTKELTEQYGGTSEEKKEANAPKSGKLLAKHAARLEERRKLGISVHKSNAEYMDYEEKRKVFESSFEKKALEWKNQAEVASKARKMADRSGHTAEELAEHAEEEREAANLRLAAQRKAKSHVTEKDSYRQSLDAQLKEAERAAEEAERNAQQAKEAACALEHLNEDLPKHDKHIRLLEKRKASRDKAWDVYESKKKAKDEADSVAVEAKRLFETSENVFSQAMRNAAKEHQRIGVQREADQSAIVAFNQARLARKQAEHALEDVEYAQSIVTERQVILKRATEYNEKMARIAPIPASLAKMTFLHTTKHRHWDKSFNLPNTHVHSFAHGVLDRMKEKDEENPERLKEFSTDHMCRTFPSWKEMSGRDKINSDPLFLWALGCQMVAMNYSTFDEHVIKADGRFRRNGSSGYVLKPTNLMEEDPMREIKETWTIDILCGSCLPAPESSKKNSTINPFVKLSVYGGDIDGKSVEHRTKVAMGNGLNPVWDEKSGQTFTSRNPSLSMCVFTVWHKGETGDEFLAASAIPVSCMREGLRSVALFDECNTRTGLYSRASLLVRATKQKS